MKSKNKFKITWYSIQNNSRLLQNGSNFVNQNVNSKQINRQTVHKRAQEHEMTTFPFGLGLVKLPEASARKR